MDIEPVPVEQTIEVHDDQGNVSRYKTRDHQIWAPVEEAREAHCQEYGVAPSQITSTSHIRYGELGS